MCGNFFSDPIGTVGNVITDVAKDPWSAIGTIGGAFLGGPVGAAIGNFAGDVASQGPSKAFGKNLGSNLEGAALSGATSYGISEAGGAFSSAFPETSAAINSYIPNIPNLGIGDTINSAEQSLGLGGSVPTTGVTPTDATGTPNPTGQPSGVPVSAQSAGNLGGGSSGGGGGAAPPSVTDYGPFQNVANQINNTGGLSSIGTPASSSNLPGGNLSSGVNSQTDSLLNSFASEQASAAPVTDSLSPSVISASNAASPNGTDISLNQPSKFANIIGSTSPVNQSISPSLSSAGNAAGGATAKASNSIGDLISHPSWENAGSALLANGAPLIAAGGVGLDALKGNKQSGAEKNLAAQAGQLSAQGQQLENYLQTGTLPPGEQAGVNQALQSAIASIKSRYASMGMSGSSAEQQDIANAQQQAQAATAQMQEQLLSTGINETGMSSQLYSELLKNSMANDTNLSNAIASFSSAAAGGGDLGKGGSYHLVQG